MSQAKRPKKARSAGPEKAQLTPSSSPINPMVRFGPENPLPLPDWGGGPCPEHLVELMRLVRFAPKGPINSADLPPRVYSHQTGFVDYVDPIESAQAKLLARDYDISLHQWDEWAELLWPHLKDWQRSMFDRVRDDAMQLEPLTGDVLTGDAADDERWLRGFDVFERFFVLRRLVLTELALHRAEWQRERYFEDLQAGRQPESEAGSDTLAAIQKATIEAENRDLERRRHKSPGRRPDYHNSQLFKWLFTALAEGADILRRGYIADLGSRKLQTTKDARDKSAWLHARLARISQKHLHLVGEDRTQRLLEKVVAFHKHHQTADPGSLATMFCEQMRIPPKWKDQSQAETANK